jgi:hypothetical protein
VRTAIVTTALVACIVAVASAQDGGTGYNAKCGEFDCRVEQVRSKWQLLDVKRDRRTLKLVYLSGGCLRGDGRVIVSETRSRIRLAVKQGQVVAINSPSGEVVCTDERRYVVLLAALRRPVGGRDVSGGPRIEDEILLNRTRTGRRGRVIALAPRVLGLAANDARTVLTSQGFRVGASGDRSGKVVAQDPAPGRLPEGHRVLITLKTR